MIQPIILCFFFLFLFLFLNVCSCVVIVDVTVSFLYSFFFFLFFVSWVKPGLRLFVSSDFLLTEIDTKKFGDYSDRIACLINPQKRGHWNQCRAINFNLDAKRTDMAKLRWERKRYWCDAHKTNKETKPFTIYFPLTLEKGLATRRKQIAFISLSVVRHLD